MTTILTAAASLIPSMLLLWLFYRSDLFPEPPKLLWRTFGLGVLAIIPAATVEGILGTVFETAANPVRALLEAFVSAALVEESLKLLVLRGYSFRKADFDEPMDGIQYGVASALGFATLENVLYVMEGGLGVAVLRGILSVPGHASWGAILGFFAGRGVLRGRRIRGSLAGLAAAVMFHGLYDFPVMLAFQGEKRYSDPRLQVAMFLVLLLVSVAGWVTVGVLVRRLRREQGRSGGTPVIRTRTLYSGRPGESRIPAAVMTALGALIGTAGGLMTIGIVLAFVFPSETSPMEDPASTALGGVLFGLMPLAAGTAAFVAGLRRLRGEGKQSPADGSAVSI